MMVWSLSVGARPRGRSEEVFVLAPGFSTVKVSLPDDHSTSLVGLSTNVLVSERTAVNSGVRLQCVRGVQK